MGRDRVISVWRARGGQGATTVALVLAKAMRATYEGQDSWAPDWILGGELPSSPDSCVVRDAGRLQVGSERTQVNLVVIRGPCLIAIRTVAPLIRTGDWLALVREPWRTLTNQEVASVVGAEVGLEVGFSERVARLVDSGLLGARLERLEEFNGLADWLNIIVAHDLQSEEGAL